MASHAKTQDSGWVADRHAIGGAPSGERFFHRAPVVRQVRVRPRRVHRHHHKVVRRAAVQPTLRGYGRALERAAGKLSLAGFPLAIITKVAELRKDCGATLVSAFRPGAKVAGTRRPSLHASKRAVDMKGKPSCLYAHMKGWKGGYSTDYSRVRHIHISWAPGGREWGSRFAHGGYRKHRYAAIRRARSAGGSGGY